MSSRIFQFGSCTVDTATRELVRDGALVPLSPRVFDCLAYLLSNRDRAVGRDELISAVWGRVDVSDTLLGQTILKARRAIGDDGNEQNAIRTIPRFGYRWVALARVEAVEPGKDSPSTGTATPGVEATKTSLHPASPTATPIEPVTAIESRTDPEPVADTLTPPWPWVAAVLAAILVVVVVAGFWPRGKPEAGAGARAAASNPHPSTTPVLAVVPAEVTAGAEWGWLRLGVMDLVASRLRHAGLAVVPSDNVVALLNTAPRDDEKQRHDRLRSATGAVDLVVPRLVHDAAGWQVHLDLIDDAGHVRSIETPGKEPIAAARAASNRLLAVLGRPLDDTTVPISLDDLDQRIRAAMLGNDNAEARRLLAAAPEAFRDSAELRLAAAEIAFRTGHLDQARQALSQWLAEFPAESNGGLRARALYISGAIAVREDRNDDAVRQFDEAVALSAAADDARVLGQASTGLAAALVNLGQYGQAETAIARARVALNLAGDTLALARVDANEGVLDIARGRPADALPLLARASERFRQFGALNELVLTGAARIRSNLALLDPTQALETATAMDADLGRLENTRTRGAFELQHARALAACGKTGEARRLLDALAGDAGQAPALHGEVALERARLQRAANSFPAAIESARFAVANLPTFDEAPARARAWLVLIRSLRSAGQAGNASAELAKFREWATSHGTLPPVLILTDLATAEQAVGDGHSSLAATAFARALAEAEHWGVPEDLAAVSQSWGNVLISQGNMDEASTVTGHVSRWAERDFECAVLQARLYRALGRREAWETALEHARSLAGERRLPATVTEPPGIRTVGNRSP